MLLIMVSFRLYRPVPVPVFYEMDSHITKKKCQHFRHRRMLAVFLTSDFIATDSDGNMVTHDSTYHPATVGILHAPFLWQGFLAPC